MRTDPRCLGGRTLYLALFCAACSARGPETSEPYRIDCDGVAFSVQYGDGIAEVHLPTGRVVRLPRALSASGARYSDGHVTFWEHQGTVRMELPDTVYVGCRFTNRTE